MREQASAPYIGGGFGHFYNYAPVHIEYAIDRFSMETKRLLDVLDKVKIPIAYPNPAVAEPGRSHKMLPAAPVSSLEI